MIVNMVNNVKLKTLDSLNLTNISFIKADIERHEFHNKCVELMKSYGYIFYKNIFDKDYIFRKEEFK